ncbi:PREDICTED: kelch-like protein 10 [Priapulus caudatus]|uniref:Kelch-like protein 10 n=1 Tax=Priapulus caudatus TaxID=37621 RepID=A0ABM1DY69_PRICU|nr:PREDICTED: kelch-like protein 10 [Priapulus caudatus]
MNTLREMRECGQLCDALIKCDGGEFQVHRAIMSACSPYFRALFTNSMNDDDNRTQRDYVIPGVDAEMLAIIIEFAYTRICCITESTVQRLLAAADQLNIMGVVRECCDFINDRIDATNCFSIRSFARAYFCKGLERRAHSYIMKNFPEIAERNDEYLELSTDELHELIDSDELNVRNEEICFLAIVRWIDHDAEARKQYIAKLLGTVRLGLLDANYFVEKVKCHPYVKDNEDCRTLVIETIKFLYDLGLSLQDGKEDKESESVLIESPLAKPRVPHEIMFAIGGWSGGSPTNLLEAYDTRADRWVKVDTVDEIGPRAYHGSVVLDKRIYIIGGFDGVEYFNSVRVFDPANKTYQEVAPMNSRRCYVSVAQVDNYIYAMGGFDGHSRLNTAERYNPTTNQWSIIAPMHYQRSDACATVMGNKIYMTGGFNGQECLLTSEYYDPETETWTVIAPMRNRRSGVSCIAYHNCLYVLGGFNGISRMCTVERWSPQTNSWTSVPDMYTPRSNFAVEIIDDMIFVVGGFNGVTTIYHVECYDEAANEWYEATDMSVFRSALSVCVVNDLPNVYDYIHKDREKLVDEKVKLNRATPRSP